MLRNVAIIDNIATFTPFITRISFKCLPQIKIICIKTKHTYFVLLNVNESRKNNLYLVYVAWRYVIHKILIKF